ncbi:unnamed protein product [Peronospora belbahrii]|uniref:6-phosphofructo-2-kinase domain-containing protein n=1 Tax=Peronospora belbahrii TaxID=622444 RepID=A0AAU9KW69_9STRA|nr:unnamed protein product [Peronospora belbahrii]CAH0517880.1 unnamed protein product [Peronospora belbahrii]
MKLNVPSLSSPNSTSMSIALALTVALQVLIYRKTIQDVVRDGRKRLLVFKTMHRRFGNQRLKRLNSLGNDRKSQWMWKKGSGVSSAMASGGSEANAEDTSSTDGFMTSQKKIVLVMVGLPARGKSFVVHKTMRYIEWLGFPTRMFNVGNLRRKLGKAGENANFFSPNNADATRLREEMAMNALDELLEWVETEGHVAVFDATNTTKLRRQHILKKVSLHRNIRVVFVESVCDNEELLEANYHRKLLNADYKDKEPEVALVDFMQRVQEYEKVYETIEDTEDDGNACYVKVYNAGEKIQARHCQGFLQSQIVSLLQNIHLGPRRIWLVRVGPSVTSCKGILGLDTDLAPKGHRVAYAIMRFVENLELERPMEIWTSPMKRSRETASYLPTRNLKRYVTTTLLNELGGGDFEGLTYEEIERFYPKHYAARLQDKLRYRYPGVGGESYVDVISRLRSLILEFERKKRDVLVICSESILRCLMGYFSGCEAAQVPHLQIYEDTVIELKPHRDGCDIKLIPLEFEEGAV